MHATVLRPPGAGPFPLVIVNHGSTQNEDQRKEFALPSYPLISEWFLRRGYIVLLPQRPGHGETGGPYFEDQGRCESAEFSRSGLATANLIQATIDHLTAQPFVRRDGVIVVGQSAGGWGALALASRNPPAVAAIVSFAGGRGGRAYDKPNNNCSPERLVAAAAEFGRSARVPTLWLYAENDSFFAPALSRRMYDSFRSAGGIAEYHLLPPVGAEGHQMINARDASEAWKPILAEFLSRR